MPILLSFWLEMNACTSAHVKTIRMNFERKMTKRMDLWAWKKKERLGSLQWQRSGQRCKWFPCAFLTAAAYVLKWWVLRFHPHSPSQFYGLNVKWNKKWQLLYKKKLPENKTLQSFHFVRARTKQNYLCSWSIGFWSINPKKTTKPWTSGQGSNRERSKGSHPKAKCWVWVLTKLGGDVGRRMRTMKWAKEKHPCACSYHIKCVFTHVFLRSAFFCLWSSLRNILHTTHHCTSDKSIVSMAFSKREGRRSEETTSFKPERMNNQIPCWHQK